LGDDEASPAADQADSSSKGLPATERTDGYREVATMASLERDGRCAVQLDGRDLALFLVGSEIRCVDGLCPHEGGPMAQGDLIDGVLTCPWHGWAFHCESGRAADGNGCSLRTYAVKTEQGRVLVAAGSSPKGGAAGIGDDDGAVLLRVLEVIDETPDVKTIKLDNSARLVPLHQPGQHVKVCVQGPSGPVWRSFTLSSPPTRPDVLELTVKRNPTGIVSSLIHSLSPGGDLRIKGPGGKFFFDPQQHKEPLVLAVAGSGVTPAMSMLRTILDLQLELPVTLLYGSRTRADVIFARELEALRLRLATLRMVVTLSLPDRDWNGSAGRITPALLHRHVPEPASARYFLCGPGAFCETLSSWLREHDVPADRIHTEQFGKSRPLGSPAAIPEWQSSAQPTPVAG
jgi:ferredoxin-NADP reductase/nitrite reductase/ring-hydroxylating ferredoxin subunit